MANLISTLIPSSSIKKLFGGIRQLQFHIHNPEQLQNITEPGLEHYLVQISGISMETSTCQNTSTSSSIFKWKFNSSHNFWKMTESNFDGLILYHRTKCSNIFILFKYFCTITYSTPNFTFSYLGHLYVHVYRIHCNKGPCPINHPLLFLK